MHHALRIPEVLLNIFDHCSTEPGSSVDLGVLARTCQNFKEPALDFLWKELYDLSPLARCLPEACYLVPHYTLGNNQRHYAFSRPLNEAEWITLRGYTRRVRFIRGPSINITEETLRVVLLAPIDEPLFPHLRSLYWNDTATSTVSYLVAPSLKTLCLHCNYVSLSTYQESFSAFADRCPHLENFDVDTRCPGPIDLAFSDLVCCWPRLQRVACSNVALNTNAILHLSSVSNLKSLQFTVENSLVQDISHLNSNLVFSNLTFLEIASKFNTITLLLRHIRLPAIEMLSVIGEEGCISSQAIQLCWAAVQEACPSNVLAYLTLYGSAKVLMDDFPDDEELPPCLTLDDLRPCTFFTELRGLAIDFECPVSLTDTNLLEIMSPRMEYLAINSERGWKIDADSGGITLSGLVRLLQKCPSLSLLGIAIDTRTFCEIPEELDVSFSARRGLEVDVLDSYILPELVLGLVSTFTTLGLCLSVLWAGGNQRELWENVLDVLKDSGLRKCRSRCS